MRSAFIHLPYRYPLAPLTIYVLAKPINQSIDIEAAARYDTLLKSLGLPSDFFA